MKILLASSSHLGIDLLKHLQNSNHQLLGAISSPDQASGRGQSVGSNEFAAHCQRNDVVCYKQVVISSSQRFFNKLKPS